MIDRTIQSFIQIAIEENLLEKLDELYVRNRLLDLLGRTDYQDPGETNDDREFDLLTLLDQLVTYAAETGVIEDSFSSKDQLSAKMMNLLTPLPSVVNDEFFRKYAVSPEEATRYFYSLSQKNNYIKTREIAKNIAFVHPTQFGELEITINLSKPEKDSKKIAMERHQTSSDYPKCLLCMENEGYEGTVKQPARANHRLIRLKIGDEIWGFQYSPYAYYNEHSIFLSSSHRPMNVGKQTVRNLLAITTLLPHYFVGSNAGLPIVGGSILSHDHYQGGRHTFPMEKAETWAAFELHAYPSVQAALVKWPMSVIRLTAADPEELTEAASFVMEKWASWDDPEAEIYSFTDGEPHNAITPIVRRRGQLYEIDLVLRNNRTTAEFPDGVFHPHPDVQHIKKENIGLIEVMGLAILPPRLKEEMNEVSLYLLGKTNSVQDYHQEWADRLKKATPGITEENVGTVIEKGIGEVFLRVLEDAAVFKPTEEGRARFKCFAASLNTVSAESPH